jgi:hypothetical protein
MKVAALDTRKTVSVKSMEIAVRTRPYRRTQAARAAPAAVGNGIDLSEDDTEEPGRRNGDQFSQQHLCLDITPNERATLSTLGALISIACAIKQSA